MNYYVDTVNKKSKTSLFSQTRLNSEKEDEKIIKKDGIIPIYDNNHTPRLNELNSISFLQRDNVYWFYHSNFVVEEQLIKKIFCTWTPFYCDLNIILNEAQKANKVFINLQDKYILDLVGKYFFRIDNPNVRRFIKMIDLNSKENSNFIVKRIFRFSQNLRIENYCMLENLNDIKKSYDFHTEKFIQPGRQNILKSKNVQQIKNIINEENPKKELFVDNEFLEDVNLLLPIEKRFRINPYVNYTNKLKLCDILNINFDRDKLFEKKDLYEVAALNINRDSKIPNFNYEIFYKEFIVSYWIIDQIKSYQENLEVTNNKRNDDVNIFKIQFNSFDDIKDLISVEINQQFDFFIDYYGKNMQNIYQEAFLKRNNFSNDFPEDKKSPKQIGYINKQKGVIKLNDKPPNEEIKNSKNITNKDILFDITHNSKYSEKIKILKKELKEFNKQKNIIKEFKGVSIDNKKKNCDSLNNNCPYKDDKSDKFNISFKENDICPKIKENFKNSNENVLSIKNPLIKKYILQKQQYLSIVSGITHENFAEKIIKIFTIEGEIYNIINTFLKNKDYYNLKLKLLTLIILSVNNNLTKSNTVYMIQKHNLLTLGKFPKTNEIYNLKHYGKNYIEQNTLEISKLEKNKDDLNNKPQLTINKNLSVLLLDKPKLKLRLYRSFEPSEAFFKKMVYSFKYKRSKFYFEDYNDIEDLHNRMEQQTNANDLVNNKYSKTLHPNKNKSINKKSEVSHNMISNVINKAYETNNMSNKTSLSKNKNRNTFSRNKVKCNKKPTNENALKKLHTKENLILCNHYNINIGELNQLKNDTNFSLLNNDKNNPNEDSINFHRPLTAFHKPKNTEKMQEIKFDRCDILYDKYIRFDEFISAYYDEEKFLLENLLDSRAKFQMVLEYDFEEIIKINCPLSFIEDFSVFPSEKEVLISPFNVYKIKDIEYVEIDKLSK